MERTCFTCRRELGNPEDMTEDDDWPDPDIERGCHIPDPVEMCIAEERMECLHWPDCISYRLDELGCQHCEMFTPYWWELPEPQEV